MPYNSGYGSGNRLPGGRYADSALYDRFEDQYDFARRDIVSGSELQQLGRSGFSFSDFTAIASQGLGTGAQARAMYSSALQRQQQSANEAYIGAKFDERKIQLGGSQAALDTHSRDSLTRREMERQSIESARDRRASFWNSVVGGILGGAGTALGAL
jgi:hypothetical protein